MVYLSSVKDALPPSAPVVIDPMVDPLSVCIC